MVGCRTYIEESDDCSYNACSNEQPNISDYIINVDGHNADGYHGVKHGAADAAHQVVVGVAALYHVFFSVPTRRP